MLLSKKKLFKALDTIFNTNEYTLAELRHPKIGNETYGKKSCVYVYTNSNEAKKMVESKLDAIGFKVNRKYNDDGKSLEVQVSYFKGRKWDE